MASILRRGQSWRALVRRKGHKSTVKTFPTKAEAERWAREQEARLDAGSVVAPSAKLSIAQLIQAYRELREAGRPILDTGNEHYMLNHLEDGLGHVPAHGLTVQHLVAFCRDRKAQGAGPYTINMEVSKLSTVLRHAGVGLNLPDVVGQARPMLAHASLIGGGGKRERRPTEDELERVIEALPQYADAIRLMVAVGLRRGEVCRIEWADIDPKKKLLLVRDRKDPRQKVGNDQWVPLIRGAWEIVMRQPQEDERIFPVHPQTLSKSFKAACDDLGIVDLHIHDLRHEAVSQMFESGMTIEQVSLVSGHRSWVHLKRYTNLKPESLHDIGQGEPPRPAHPTSASRSPHRSAAKTEDQ